MKESPGLGMLQQTHDQLHNSNVAVQVQIMSMEPRNDGGAVQPCVGDCDKLLFMIYDDGTAHSHMMIRSVLRRYESIQVDSL